MSLTKSIIRYTGAGNAASFAADFAVVGGTAAAGIATGAMAMRRTSWTYAQRGAIQGAVGMGLGILLAPKLPRIALGLATAGVVAAVKGGLEEVEMRRYIQSTTQRPNPATTPTTQPSGALYSPRAPMLPSPSTIMNVVGARDRTAAR